MRTPYRVLILILLAATAVRAYHIQTQSIWFDEGWSAYAAVQPTLIDAIEADATNPPLYYLLLNIFVKGAGDSELTLRWFSLLLGLVGVALAYQLGRRLFSVYAGVGAAFMLAFSPLMWWAGQEARMYTLLAALVTLAALAWHSLLRQSSRRFWVILWVAELALLYAHNTGPVVALWLNLVTLLIWMSARSLQRPQWRNWIIGQIGIFILWSPWLITRFLLLTDANSAVTTPPQIGFGLLGAMWGALWGGAWSVVVLQETSILAWSIAALLVALVIIPWRRTNSRWLIIHSVILNAGLLIGLSILGNDLHGRYLVMVAPLPLVVIGAGLGEWVSRRGLLRVIGYGAAMFFGVMSLYSVNLNLSNPVYQHDDARAMVRYYADHLDAGDTVLAWSYADRYELRYYWDKVGAAAGLVTLPEGADLEAVLPLLPKSGDVALNRWFTQRADFRGMLPCLLGSGTINLPETFDVYGMTNQIYRDPLLTPPAMNSFDLSFEPARLVEIGSLPDLNAAQGLCIPLRVLLTQPIQHDLKAAVSIKNSLGWEVARTDVTFADPGGRTNAGTEAGDVLTAYPLLRLPYGAPPSEYSIWLRLYDEAENIGGFDALNVDNLPAGKDTLLTHWLVQPGADWVMVNRETDLPTRVDLPVGDDLLLLAHNLGVEQNTITNGSVIPMVFLWEGDSPLPELTLMDSALMWSVSIAPPELSNPSAIRLDWREARIPADAGGGLAFLTLPSGEVIAQFTVDAISAVYDEPDFAQTIGATIPGIGQLSGFTLHNTPPDRTQALDITLVWLAEGATAESYTVFVQIISLDGRVIAQSDSVPVNGTRPTTGWRTGEYIIDQHQLQFHADAPAGTATLIAGLYDPATGQRAVLDSEVDFAVLAEGIEVR